MFSLIDWLKKQANKSAKNSGKNKHKRNNVARTTRSNSKGNQGARRANTVVRNAVGTGSNASRRGGVVISNKTATKIKNEQQRKKQQSQSLTGTENYKKLQKKREEAAKRGGNRTREDRKQAVESTKDRLKHVYEANAKSISDQTKKALEKSQNIDALGVKNGTTTYIIPGSRQLTSPITDKVVSNIKREKNWKPGMSDEFKKKEEVTKDDYKKESSRVSRSKQTEKSRTVTVKNLNSGDYNRMVTAAMTGQLQNLMKNDKQLAKKVADKNVADYANGTGVMGAIDRMTMGLSVSDDPVYKYTDEQKKFIESQKNKTSYNVGRMIGAIGEFALGGTNTLGSGLVKAGAKAGTKNILKTAAKETAADALVSTPLNLLDAAKASYKDGKIDKNKFAKEAALNIGGDIALGGLVSGAGAGAKIFKTKADYYKYIKIKAKKEAGAKLTKAEQDFYNKGNRELTNQYIEKEVQKEMEALKSKASESSIKVNENHTKQEIERINKYRESTDLGLLTFIDKVDNLSDKNVASKLNKSIGKVGQRESEAIKKITGIDVSGFGHNINGATINHIKNRHGINGKADSSMAINSDIARLNHIIKEYDNVYAVKTSDLDKDTRALSKAWQNSNQSPSQVIRYEKRVDGTYYIVEAVPDSNKKKLQVISAYISNKKSTPELVNMENSPHLTSKTSAPSVETDSTKAPNADVGPEPTARGTTSSLLDNSISRNGENVNNSKIDPEWEKAANQLVEDAQNPAKRNPETIKRESRSGAALFDDAVKKADYKAEAEKIIAENPQIGQNAAKQNVLYYTTEDAQAMFYKGLDDGMFGKSKKVTQEQARETVDNLFKSESVEDLANRFLGMDYTSDPHLFGAFAEKILPELSKKVETGNADALQLLMKVSDHANSIVSHGASITNAAKMWVKMTPIGRCKAITKEVERLNKQYGDRLKKPLELTDEHKEMIFKAQTDEEIGKAVAKVTEDLWDDIPSTYWEKLNTARHIGMLLNVRTNLRNVLGNTAFASVRAMSNSLEFMMTRAMKSTLQKNGADAVRATHVTGDEMKKAKDFIENEFASHYNANSQKYRDQLDLSKPENKTTLESKIGSSVEKLTYALLEKGDIVFFKPEYKRSYARWCKSNGIELDKLSEMTNLQKAQANEYAMKEAEKATFRETTKVSNALTKLKEKTATGKGRTVAGTAGLRVANAALESVMPFVKTPINVFRQSIDYSPAGLLKVANDLITYKARGDIKSLENAIHHMSTTLTGSGIAVLGAFLYANDIVTVKAGEKSGDAYYDRDVGYQDYSLVIGNHSWTIDWASPMQSSFFMGAQIFKMSEDKGYTTEEIFNGLMSLVLPHLESSFMSSAKDTLELFTDTAYNRDLDNGETNWGGAILKTLGGTIPQNYISTLLPFTQLMSQTAGFSDKYQRDTRSTKEDILGNSWESWGRKMINRIPGLRQELLNPKVNRKGQDVKSSDNILTRFMNSFVNPSTVKTITLDDTDRELIKIYKDIDTTTDEGKSKKKYFFYNFTGNPDYDLANGKRMTYDEAYKYSKASRQEQNKCVESMLKSQSYKNMTNKLKTDEIKSSYYIGKAMGDLKTYGAEYACSNLNRDTDKKIYEAYSAHGGKSNDFMDFYINKEKFIARSHESDYYTKAVAIALYGDKTLAKAYDLKDERFKDAKKYIENGGSAKEYSNAMCNVVSTIDKSDVNVNMPNKAVAAAYHKINNRTRKAMGLDNQYSNMGIWFKENGYTFDALEKIKNNGALMYDIDTKAGTIEYIDSLGLDDWIEKACIFRYLNDSNNPYGIIPNYLEMDNDDSVKSGSGGYRRYGRSYGRRGGSGGSSVSMESWEEYVKQFITTPDTSTVKTSYKSPLDEAYRAKVNKIIKNMRS